MLGAWLAFGCAYSIVEGNGVRQDDLDRVAEATMEARGLRTQQEIRAFVVTQTELHDILEEALFNDWSPDEIRQAERAMVAMGLWPWQRDLLSVYLDVLSQEVAGLYVPHDRRLYLVRDFETPVSVRLTQGLVRRDLAREIILAHEIVHLLQDEAFPNLLEPDRFLHTQDDLAYALQASFEGDATHYGLRAVGVLDEDLPTPAELRESMEAASDLPSYAPEIVRRTLIFPYVEGYRLSLEEGAALLEAPPISTEQVLHTARRREPFHAYDLRPLDDLLPQSCQRVHENTVGELALSVLFSEARPDAPSSAWQGWDGDRYLVVDCDRRLEFVWATSWDSEEDAREFALAYDAIAGWIEQRKRRGGRPMVLPRGREVWVVTTGLAPAIESFVRLTPRRQVSNISEIRAFFDQPRR